MAISKHILNGVESVPKLGIPGTIAVFGPDAEGVLTGKGASDVLIAAANYGKGKVVVFSQDAYPKQFLFWATSSDKRLKTLDRLNGNIARWILGNSCDSFQQTEVLRVDESKQLNCDAANLKILVWAGSDIENPKMCDFVKKFVKRGGGLVAGCTPWGYLQSRPNKTLWDLPLNDFIVDFGLAFGPHYINGENFDVAANKAHMSNIRHILKVCDFGSDAMSPYFDVFTKSLPNCHPRALADLAELLEEIYRVNREKVHHSPCPDKPVTKPSGKALMAICDIVHRYAMPDDAKLPGVGGFPGDFGPEPPLDLHNVTLEINAPRLDYYSTGFYAPAGKRVSVEILSKMDPEKVWILLIGCHTDNTYDCTRYKRWPVMIERMLVTQKKMSVTSKLGGPVYFLSPRSTSTQTLKVSLSNLVESPYIDLTDPKTIEDWGRRKDSPGLWADMCGEFITFTLPSINIRDLQDPVPVLQLWDRVNSSHHELKGSSIRRNRRQWIVFDIQPRMGYMHAGYPIVAKMEYHLTARMGEIPEFALDFDHVKNKGSWAIFHEMGHNMQDHAWTFDGTSEVTVNIFTLHAMEVICGIPHWIHDWVERQFSGIAKYVNVSCQFVDWKKQYAVGLSVYLQLIHHFGWGSMKTVLRLYEEMPRRDKPRENQDKIDKWVTNYSKTVQMNLCPLFDFWGVPISKSVRDSLAPLSPFLPDDEFVKLCTRREGAILEQYPTAVRCGILVIDNFEYSVEPPFTAQPYVRVSASK